MVKPAQPPLLLQGICFLFLGTTFLHAATTLHTESFETDGLNTRYTASTPFNDGVSDHWRRTNGSDISNSSASYSGANGSWYWAAEDTDDTGTNGGNGLDEQSLTLSNINITGYNNLTLSLLVAADGFSAAIYNFDSLDYIRVKYRIDGGSEQNAIWFSYDDQGGVFNQRIGRDTNFDGEAEGTLLTPVFQGFQFSIPSTGSSLEIIVYVSMDGGSEEIAFDNIQVTGDPVLVNTAPQVSNSVRPNIGEPEIGQTSYSFTVTYSDNSAIKVNTVSTGDVSISGPGGSIPITSAVANINSDGTPRTVTYTATPPGGSWNAADNGTYTISLLSNQIGDDGTPQLFASAKTLGTFTVAANNTLPSITEFLYPHINYQDILAAATTWSIQITYADVGGIDISTVDVNDLTVSNGVQPLTCLSATASPNTDGSPRTVTYTFLAPGGFWDAADAVSPNNVYQIGVNANQVFDLANASIPANASLASFEVHDDWLFFENFHSDGQGTRYTSSPEFYTSPDDVWGRRRTTEVNPTSPITGADWPFNWFAEDADNQGLATLPQTLIFGPYDIAAHENLQFSADFAATGLSAGPFYFYDSTDSIRVFYSLDGGAYQNLIWFSADGPNGTLFDERLRLDSNFDGQGEGTALTPALSAFTGAIPNGSTLTIRIEVSVDANQEEVALANVTVSGDYVGLPPTPQPDTLERFPGGQVKVRIADLMINDTDPQSSSLAFVGVSNPQPAGATVQVVGDWILYQSTTSTAGSFEYTVANPIPKQASTTVTVNLAVDNELSNNLASIEVGAPGTFVITFNGIPGVSYQAQFTSALTPPTTVWTNLGSPVVADAFGKVTVSHTAATPAGYYRLAAQ